ncbi:MAG: hypothetical protein DDT32_01942 [Syntrophomonadaceae bacterium]|nr:hypothetical protein [Bacillota bacterium]
MMNLNVYELEGHDDYEWLLPVDEEDYKLLYFEGQPMANSWRPIKMERLKNDADITGRRRRRLLKESDFPTCGSNDMLVISQAAKDKIGSCLEQYGEILPLACDDGDFWVLNVTRLLDAFDEKNSEFIPGDAGRILTIDKHVFYPSKLVGAPPLFKLSQKPYGSIYVMDSFVDMIKASGLKGLEFVKVWPHD